MIRLCPIIGTLSVLFLLAAGMASCGEEEGTPSTPTDLTQDTLDTGDQVDSLEEEPAQDVLQEEPADEGDGTVDPVPDFVDLEQAEEEPVPEDVICRPCFTSDECGAPGNACLTLPSGESVCGLDCSTDVERCPDGTFCAEITSEEEVVYQCVPERLYCVNRCGDPPRQCTESGDICDPITGECHPPFGLCEECIIDEQCGPGNYCLTFPDIDQSRACGIACTATGHECPEGFLCALVDEEGTIRQCIPEVLTCIERCEEVVCDPGTMCNPLNGLCEPPLELCDPCLTNAQCGGPTDLCLGLLDGYSYCGQDCGPTAGDNEGTCPPGYFCYPLGAGVSQCVPTFLTCVDHCLEPEPVDCLEGQNCEPIDGTCHPALYDLCEGPCEYNYECGGQDDLCIAFSGAGGTFCGAHCDEVTPCAVGYTCYPLTDNLRYQCGPTDYELLCTNCEDLECPEGEACRPVDGTCLPPASFCLDHLECREDEVCNYYQDRCEPIGLACRYNEYLDCPYGTACDAASLDMWGTCLLECDTRPEGCPDTSPECGDFYRPWWDVCVERGLGGPERCGRLVDWDQLVGRPCPSSSTSTGCPSTASVCLQDVVPGIPGFCTSQCDPTGASPCPYGGRCAHLPGITEAYCVPTECQCVIQPELDVGELDVVQAALDVLELDRCDITTMRWERETAGAHVANDPWRLERVGKARNEPLSGADLVGEQLDLLADPASLVPAIELAAADLGQSLAWAYMDFSSYDLCSAIQGLWFGSDQTAPTCGELADLEAAIPESMRASLAAIIAAAGFTSRQRDSILPTEMDAAAFNAMVASLQRFMVPEPTAPPELSEIRELLLGYKYPVLFWAAANLANAIENALPGLDRDDPSPPLAIDIAYSTPLGWIVVQGDDDHVYCDHPDDCAELEHGVVLEDSILLLVDTLGNDTYLVPAGSAVGHKHGVSVFLDLGGDDLYSYLPAEDDPHADHLYPADDDGRASAPMAPVSLSEVGRQGSARGGVGLLFDLGQGSDTYQSLRMSQGFGLLGVGALVDDGCTPAGEDGCQDNLRSEALSQGAGLFGVGILLLGPTDSALEGFHLVQGVGGPLGLGLVVDAGGDETYTAWPGDADNILYTSPVLPSLGNWSAAQGAGIGVPADRPETGGNLSGGMGLLVDLGGQDTFLSGVMAQGAGYWHGLGALLESQGDDLYHTLGYSQGSGLDFGMGILVDQSGADTYNEVDTIDRHLLGSGENFGVGLVIEEAGHDLYRAGAQSLGVGFFNGMGLFVENDGNDDYDVTSAETLGKATLSILGSEPLDNPRRTARTIGLFLDAGGIDTYSGRSLEDPVIGQGTIWIQRTDVPPGQDPLIEWGIGADQQGGTGIDTLE